MELESFILELLQWIRVLQIWDVSFLNSLETMLTNKIIREIVLFWKKILHILVEKSPCPGCLKSESLL